MLSQILVTHTEPPPPLFPRARLRIADRRKLEALSHQQCRALILALFITLTEQSLHEGHHEFALCLVKTFNHFRQELRICA